MLKVKKIKPMFTALITTMDKYEEDVRTSGGLLDVTKQQGGLKEYQTVLAIGSSVRDIKVGDLVCVILQDLLSSSIRQAHSRMV